MPQFESESLVLRSYNLAEADRIVVFFTRENGVVRGVAKGAKRLRSKFGSTLELFSTVQLSYLQKDDRELVSIQHVELVKSCFSAAADPEFLHTFSYLADLLMAFVPPHDPNERLYRMAKACLDTDLSSPDRLTAIRLYFELWLLRLGGYLPDWGRCHECKRELAVNARASLRADFHVICDSCRQVRRLPEVTSAHLKIFANVQRISPAEFVETVDPDGDAVAEVSGVLRRIITQIVGRDLMNEQTRAVYS